MNRWLSGGPEQPRTCVIASSSFTLMIDFRYAFRIYGRNGLIWKTQQIFKPRMYQPECKDFHCVKEWIDWSDCLSTQHVMQYHVVSSVFIKHARKPFYGLFDITRKLQDLFGVITIGIPLVNTRLVVVLNKFRFN